jgi:transposase
MSHRSARQTFCRRCLLIERVRSQEMPIAHVAEAMGISRQCAHRWLGRFEAKGYDPLHDRSSSPRATDADTLARVLEARRTRREGPEPLSHALGIPPRTISRILARHGVPR